MAKGPKNQKPPTDKVPGKKLRRTSSKLLAHKLAERRAQVAKLRAMGLDYSQIAHELGIHTNTVITDMQWVAKSWHEHMLQDYRTIREREVGLLEAARAEALYQWTKGINRHGEGHLSGYMAVYAKLTQMLHELLNLKDPLSFASVKAASSTAQMRTKIIEVEIQDRSELKEFQAMSLARYKRMIGEESGAGVGVGNGNGNGNGKGHVHGNGAG